MPDIVLADLRIVVEYDGAYWHRARHETDLVIDRMYQEAGFAVIRVRERPLPLLGRHDVPIDAWTPDSPSPM